MGLAVQAYWLIALSRRPLAAFGRADSPVASIIVFGGLIAVGGWILFGGLVGLLVEAVRSENNDAILIPSAPFLLVLLFLSVLGMMPALVLMPTWKRHIFTTFLLFAALFGLLLPNLVVAAQE